MVQQEGAFAAVEANTGGSRPKELFLVSVPHAMRERSPAVLLAPCVPKRAQPIAASLLPSPSPVCAPSPTQDVLEEMEAEYGKEREAVKAAAKAHGLEVSAATAAPLLPELECFAQAPPACPLEAQNSLHAPPPHPRASLHPSVLPPPPPQVGVDSTLEAFTAALAASGGGGGGGEGGEGDAAAAPLEGVSAASIKLYHAELVGRAKEEAARAEKKVR